MNAWMRWGTAALTLPALVACGRLLIETPLFRMVLEPVQLTSAEIMDIDAWRGEQVRHDGENAIFYPDRGILFHPASRRFYRVVDDPGVRRPMRSAPRRHYRAQASGDPVTAEGKLLDLHLDMIDPASSSASVSVSWTGSWQIPLLDDQQYPTLHRELFVDPDGTAGTPDPVTMVLHGVAADVLGYMVDGGLVEASGTQDGVPWFVSIDGEVADVFMNDVFACSIVLD